MKSPSLHDNGISLCFNKEYSTDYMKIRMALIYIYNLLFPTGHGKMGGHLSEESAFNSQVISNILLW